MKKSFLLMLLLGASSASALPERIASIHLREINSFASNIAAVAASFGSPIPPDMLMGQFGQLIKVSDFDGIDFSRPVTVITGADSDMPKAKYMAIRFFVQGDGRDYLDRVSLQLPAHAEVRPGVHEFRADGSDEDAFVVILDGQQALVGENLDVIQALSDSIPTADEQIISALPGNLSIDLNLPAIQSAMQKQIEEQKKRMAEMREKLEAQGVDTTQMSARDPMAGAESSLKMMNRIFAELRTAVVNLDIKDDDVTARLHVQPQPGSMVAGLLDAMQPVSSKIADFRDSQAFLTFYGSMEGFDSVVGPYSEWVADLYRKMGPPMDAFADKYKKMVTSMAGIYRGGYNLLLLAPRDDAWLQGMGVYEIHDPEKARIQNETLLELEINEFSVSNGFPFAMRYVKEENGSYQGIDIYSYRMEVDVPSEMESQLPLPFSKIMNGMRYHVAYLDKAMPYAFGDITNLYRMIDYLQSEDRPAAPSDEFPDIASPRIGFWELDFGRLLAALGPAAGPLAAANMNAKMRGLYVKELGGLTAVLRIGQADLLEFKRLGDTMKPKRRAHAPPVPQN